MLAAIAVHSLGIESKGKVRDQMEAWRGLCVLFVCAVLVPSAKPGASAKGRGQALVQARAYLTCGHSTHDRDRSTG